MKQYLYNLATDKYNGRFAAVPKLMLFILSLVYGLIVRITIFFCRLKPYRLGCKVVSVGNITLGGTGKTPLVELTARYLKSQGHKIAVLTRGYKRRIRQGCSIPNPETMGDEPFMLKIKLPEIPIIVNPDRVSAANTAMRDFGIDTVILDDGLQQWRIKKDLEIVAIDSRNAFGNRQMLPRGILREPLSSLKRADIFVLTKAGSDTANLKGFLRRVNPRALITQVVYHPVAFYELGRDNSEISLDSLKGKTVALFCGIADPESFRQTIQGSGINIGLSFIFPDHYPYRKEDLENIIVETKNRGIDTIVTTEKDAVRLSASHIPQPVPRILVLRIELKIIENEQGFYNRLLSLYPF